MVSGFDTSSEGQKTITITYAGKTVQYTIQVYLHQDLDILKYKEKIVTVMLYIQLASKSDADWEERFDSSLESFEASNEEIDLITEMLEQAQITDSMLSRLLDLVEAKFSIILPSLKGLNFNDHGVLENEGNSFNEIFEKLLTKENIEAIFELLQGVTEIIPEKIALNIVNLVLQKLDENNGRFYKDHSLGVDNADLLEEAKRLDNQDLIDFYTKQLLIEKQEGYRTYYQNMFTQDEIKELISFVYSLIDNIAEIDIEKTLTTVSDLMAIYQKIVESENAPSFTAEDYETIAKALNYFAELQLAIIGPKEEIVFFATFVSDLFANMNHVFETDGLFDGLYSLIKFECNIFSNITKEEVEELITAALQIDGNDNLSMAPFVVRVGQLLQKGINNIPKASLLEIKTLFINLAELGQVNDDPEKIINEIIGYALYLSTLDASALEASEKVKIMQDLQKILSYFENSTDEEPFISGYCDNLIFPIGTTEEAFIDHLKTRGQYSYYEYIDGQPVEMNIPINNNTIIGFDSATIGNKTFTVTYNSVSQMFDYIIYDPADVRAYLSYISFYDVLRFTLNDTRQINSSFGLDIELVDFQQRVYIGRENDNFEVIGLDTSKVGEGTLFILVNDRRFGKFAIPKTYYVYDPANPTVTNVEFSLDKHVYLQGEEITGDLYAYKDYSYSSDKLRITESMITGYDSSQAGKQTITLTYKGFSKEIVITVITEAESKTLTKLVLNSSNSLVFLQNEDFDHNKVYLIAVYGGGYLDKPLTREDYEVEGFDKTKLGIQQVTLKFEGMSQQIEVEVITSEKAHEIVDLYYSSWFNHIVVQNDELHLDIYNLEAKAYYPMFDEYIDDMEALLASGDLKIEKDTSVIGEHEIYLEYKGFRKSIGQYKVISFEESKIPTSVTADCNRTIFKIGDELDISDIAITVELAHGYEYIYLNGGSEGVSVSGFDTTKVGNIAIVASYLGITSTIQAKVITVEYAETITRLIYDYGREIKLVYVQGESLDTKNAYYYVQYGGGYDESFYYLQESDISGFDSSVIGIRTINIDFGEVHFTKEIRIIKESEKELVTAIKNIDVDQFVIGLPMESEYIAYIEYGYGYSMSYVYIPSSALTVDLSSIGTKELTVNYEGLVFKKNVYVDEVERIGYVYYDQVITKGEDLHIYSAQLYLVETGYYYFQDVSLDYVTGFDKNTVGQQFPVLTIGSCQQELIVLVQENYLDV